MGLNLKPEGLKSDGLRVVVCVTGAVAERPVLPVDRAGVLLTSDLPEWSARSIGTLTKFGILN